MPLDSTEIDSILRARGLLKDEPASKSAPPPAPPPPPPVVAQQEGYQPGVGLVINIPGTPSANAPEVVAPAGTPAIASPTAVAGEAPAGVAPSTPTTPAATPVSPVPPAPTTDLSTTVARARDVIGGMESGDRYNIVHPPAKNGQVALGRYGILASGLADDSQKYLGRPVSQDEFLKNPKIQDEIFDKRFGALVEKYGVEGAARAWFAGEGGMNNDRASDGNTTVANYASQFMQKFGGATSGAVTGAAPVRATGGSISPDQVSAILSQRGVAPTESDVPPKSLFETAKTQAVDLVQAYTQYEAGVMKGIAGVVLAPVQTASEMTGDWYKPVEERVKQLEDALDEHTGGKGTWPDLAGRVVGSVASIVIGARALGPLAAPVATRITPQIARTIWSGIGPVGRSVATAAPLAATTYYPEGSVNEHRLGLEHLLPARAIDAATFGVLGPIGGVVARGATWIAQNLAATTSAARTAASDAASAAADAAFKARGPQVQTLFNDVLQSTANGMTKNSEGPLQNAIANYARVERLGQQKYAVRNAAGQQFEGFESGVTGGTSGMKQALGEGAEATAEAGVRQSPKAGAAREAARRELGLPEEEARYRGWQTQQQEYERRALDWQTAMEGQPYAGPQLLASMERAGKIPPRPQPPPPFVPTPIGPEQFSAARTALNDAWKRAKGDAAAQTQISQMIRGIDRVAEDAAAAHGLPVNDFMRKAAEAADFYKKNIAPLRYGLFGGRTSTQLAGQPGVPLSGMTPTEFHKIVMTPVRENNLERVRDLVKVLGPNAQHDLAGMAASEMILLSKEGARKFVREHEAVLTELMGQNEYAQLKGLAAIAEHIEKYKPYALPRAKGTAAPPASSFVSRLLEGGDSNRIGKWMAFYQMGHAVLGLGNPAQHLKEAALYFFGPSMAHLAYNTVTRLHEMPVLRPLVRRAASMEPGSRELDNYLTQIERRIRGTSNATLRSGSEALDQQP